MEIRTIVVANSYEEIDESFEFDEVLNIRYFEKIGKNTYKTIIRIPDCNIRVGNRTTLKHLKEKVMKANPDIYSLKSKVILANGTERIIYTANEDWENEYANRLAELNHSTVVAIERQKSNWEF